MRNRKYELLQIIMMRKIEDRRMFGRKKALWLLNLRQWIGIPEAASLFRIAIERDNDREMFEEMIR